MHVRIIHQYFRTPGEGGGLRTWYMGRYLIQKGYTVSVITGGNISGYTCKNIQGMEVHYLPIYYSNYMGFLARINAFRSFVNKSIRLSKSLPPADVHYILTTPLTTGLIGLKLKKKYGTPYVFEVGDIWPEAPRQLGVLTNTWLLNQAKKLEMKSYSGADALVGLSPEITDYLKQLMPDKPVHCIPNVSDIEFFKPVQKEETIPAVKSKFVISYIGTLGMANHLEYLIDALSKKPGDLNAALIIMGDGAQADRLKNRAGNMENIHFLDQGSRDMVRNTLNASDAVIVSFKNAPILASGSPNKLFDGLAAGKMVIVNFGGWIRSLIESNECGIYYSPEKPEQLWQKLQPFITNKRKLRNYQENARRLAVNQFSTERIFSTLDKLMQSINPSGSAH